MGKTHDAEDCITVSSISNRVVDHVVFLGRFFSPGLLHSRQTALHVTHVYLGQRLIKQNLGGKQLEFQPKLLIIDILVTTEVKKGILEVLRGEIISLEEEVGHSALEVCNRQELVELCRLEEMVNSRFVFSEGSVDEAHVCEDLGRVGDLGEHLERLFKVLFIIGFESGCPGFEFGFERHCSYRRRVDWGLLIVNDSDAGVPDAETRQAPGLEKERKGMLEKRRKRSGGSKDTDGRPEEQLEREMLGNESEPKGCAGQLMRRMMATRRI